MSIVTGDLLARARVMLHDVSATQRFTDTEILSAIALAIAAVGYLRPLWATQLVATEVSSTSTFVSLDNVLPGTFKPFLLAEGIGAIAPRYGLLRTTRAALDRSDPGWSIAANADASALRRYAIDDGGETVYMTPGPGAITWQLRGTATIWYGGALNSAISITAPAVFTMPLLYYICYFLLNSDTADAQERQLATTYYRLFVASVSGTWPEEDE